MLTVLLCITPALGLMAQDLVEPLAYVRVASFEDAQRLAADAFGNLYVIDRGARRLVRISATGLVRKELGGSGSRLSDPAGIDPTNGLLIFVTDRSSGRIFRFNRELVPLGAIGEMRLASTGVGSDRDTDDRGSRGQSLLQPTEIVVGREGEVFVIDRAERDIVKFDANYDFERRIGEFGSGRGALSDPVAITIAADGRRLLVVDADEPGIVVFDLHGAFIRRISVPGDDEVLSIRDTPAGLMAVRPNGINVLVGADWHHQVVPDHVLTDALFIGEDLLLLTRRTLFRTDLPTLPR